MTHPDAPLVLLAAALYAAHLAALAWAFGPGLRRPR